MNGGAQGFFSPDTKILYNIKKKKTKKRMCIDGQRVDVC